MHTNILKLPQKPKIVYKLENQTFGIFSSNLLMFLFYNNRKSESYHKNFLIKKPNNIWKDKKRSHFVHSNKNAIYMQKKKKKCLHSETPNRERNSVNCRMSEQSIQVTGEITFPFLLGSCSSPGGYHTSALYRQCTQDERS